MASPELDVPYRVLTDKNTTDKMKSSSSSVFNIRSQRDMPDGFIRTLAKKMKVPKQTIASWRRHLFRDSSRRRGSGHGRRRRSLTDKEEMEFAEMIRRDNKGTNRRRRIGK
jgi:hypothetical protein